MGVVSGGGGSGGSQPAVQFASVPVSAAELKNLQAVQPTIVATPGPGKYLRPLTVDLSFTPGATAYTVPSGLFLVVSPSVAVAQTTAAWAEWACASAFANMSLNMETALGDVIDPPADLSPFAGNIVSQPIDQNANLFGPGTNAEYIVPGNVEDKPLLLCPDRVTTDLADGDGIIVLNVVYVTGNL